MDSVTNYGISWFGELTDKSLEDEFLADRLDASKKVTAYIALVFGSILGLFLVNSYFTEGGTIAFARITPVRLMFILVSVLIFFIAGKVGSSRHLAYLITFYQSMMGITYLLTLKYYDSLNYFSVIALMVITLAMYLLPNRIAFSQIVSLVFTLLFFAFPSKKLDGLQIHQFFRIVAYQTILLVYCNINYSLAGRAQRRTFMAHRKLLELSAKDALTGAYNRKKFDDEMDQWIRFSTRYGQPLSLILFDIDNFKGINDHYGHIVGDGVLQKIASIVRQSIRETDVFARWGGDEFAVLLPNTNLYQAKTLAERLQKSIAASSMLENDSKITCSFGVAECEPDDTKQSLLRRVDDLLLEAKAGGKNKVAI